MLNLSAFAGETLGELTTEFCDVATPPPRCAATGGSLRAVVDVEGTPVHAMIFFTPVSESQPSAEAILQFLEATEEGFATCADDQPPLLSLPTVVNCMYSHYLEARQLPPRAVLLLPELLIEYSSAAGHILIPYGYDSATEDADLEGSLEKGVPIFVKVEEEGPRGKRVKRILGPTLFLMVLPPTF